MKKITAITIIIALSMLAVRAPAEDAVPVTSWYITLEKPLARALTVRQGETRDFCPMLLNYENAFTRTGAVALLWQKSPTSELYGVNGWIDTNGQPRVRWESTNATTPGVYSYEIIVWTNTTAIRAVYGTLTVQATLNGVTGAPPTWPNMVGPPGPAGTNIATGDWNMITNLPALVYASDTNGWEVGSHAGLAAAGAVAALEARTSAWNTASANAVTATSAIPRITALEASTGTWGTVTGAVMAADATYTAAVAAALSAYPANNPSGYVDRASATAGMQVAGAYLTNENDSLQTVITRGGTVTSGVVTIDAAGERTNTFGGSLTILGSAVKSQLAIDGMGTGGATALGLETHASGSNGAIALGYATVASGNNGATAIGDHNYASGFHGATAFGYQTTASGNNGAIALGWMSESSNNSAFVWGSQGGATQYGSHGDGTINLDPTNGVSGIWIGETTLGAIISNAIPTNAAQVGAVSTNDARYLSALTNLTGAAIAAAGGLTNIPLIATATPWIASHDWVWTGRAPTTNAACAELPVAAQCGDMRPWQVVYAGGTNGTQQSATYTAPGGPITPVSIGGLSALRCGWWARSTGDYATVRAYTVDTNAVWTTNLTISAVNSQTWSICAWPTNITYTNALAFECDIYVTEQTGTNAVSALPVLEAVWR